MLIVLCIALAVTAVAALTDARTGHIPNVVTGTAFLIGLGVNAADALGRAGVRAMGVALLASLAGALLCALVPLALHRARAIGGGDVKLFAALGAIGGTVLGLEIELSGFAAGALLVVAVLAVRRELLGTLVRSLRLLVGRPLGNERAPTWFRLGPAIFLGTAWVAYRHWSGS